MAARIIGIFPAGEQGRWLGAGVDDRAHHRAFFGAQEILPPIDFQMGAVDAADQRVAVQFLAHPIADRGAGRRRDAAIIHYLVHAASLPVPVGAAQ